MRQKAFFILLFILILVPFAHVHALQATSTKNDIIVNSTPSNPQAFQQVTLSVLSYTIDLHASNIEWSVDSKIQANGIGLDRFTITTKGTGAPTQVTAIITPLGSLPIVKNITITPMSVDILWEAPESAVPPFYRGKAMPTSESGIKFVAIPQVKSAAGTFLPAGSFIYNWSDEFTPTQINSGYAKDSYETSMTYVSAARNVQVDIVTPDGSIGTKSNVEVTPVTPKILWYASSPLYGPLYDNALSGTYSVEGNDTSIIAEPYFFTPRNTAAKVLNYEWTLNGSALDTPHIPNTLFLHRDSESTGIATLRLSITNIATLFQEATTSLTLSLQ